MDKMEQYKRRLISGEVRRSHESLQHNTEDDVAHQKYPEGCRGGHNQQGEITYVRSSVFAWAL